MKFNDRDLIIELTPEWKGERFPDGRPKVSDDILNTIIAGLGGADNIVNVDACFTRLRVKVKDKALVMEDKAWKEQTQANGVVRVNDGVQIIYGTKADIYKNNLKNILGME